jgi:tristetraprolin
MQLAFTDSSATTKGFLSKATDDLLPPISLTKDTLNWPLIHDPEGEVDLENWHLSSSDETTSLYRSAARRTFSTNIQSIPFSSAMTRLDSNPSDRANLTNGSQRWRLNKKGQFIDSEPRGWGLPDELARLKLDEVDEAEGVHGSVQSPPKSSLAVSQLDEGSPLDSSSTSAGSSPQAPEHQITLSHSRGSSTDTSISSSHDSSISTSANTLQAHVQTKSINSGEVKGRLQPVGDNNDPADAQRAQSWGQNHQGLDNSGANSELSYPSLLNHIHRPQPQLHPNLYDLRAGLQQSGVPRSAVRDDDYRDYSASAPGLPAFVPGQPGGAISGLAYRQPPPRAYPQQGIIGSPNISYQGSHHTAHLSLGNTQQLYDMMLPDNHSVIARVQQQQQQQHNAFRPSHHHSASDPSALRDPAALALLANSMQAFAPSLQAPPLPFYPNQYFGTQDAYPRPEVTAAQIMAARLQQFNAAYGAAQGSLGVENTSPVVPSPTSHHPGPSTNNRKINLYKTELCRSWEEKGTCRYGAKCQFAHGEEELRKISRHPKYKTEICRTFWVSGSCPYGKRCCFIHTEVPSNGNTNPGSGSASDSATPQLNTDGRARSMSTNSDPNDTSGSLLARISMKRTQETNTASTPVDTTPKNVSFARPPAGSLRVDTSSLDGPSLKQQNKSAYPSFTSNGILLPASEQITAKSPGPVTAGPDLGRHNAARLEIVGYNSQRSTKTSTPSNNNNIRNSFNGGDLEISFKSTASSQSSILSPIDNVTTPRASGHARAGSAGNWASLSRSGPMSAYPHGPSQAGAWSSADLAIGSTRLSEKAWA